MMLKYLETCCIASRKNTNFISLEELMLKSSKYYRVFLKKSGQAMSNTVVY